MRGPGQPAAPVMGVDIAHHDAPIAQFGATQHGLQSGHQSVVTAPVRAEGLLLARGLRRRQVGDDIAATERIDGLLGIPDQHHGGYLVEGLVDHAPLHRVGVLELIDHHDRPASAHPLPGRGILAGQRLGQPGQQVVVAEDSAAALADIEFGEDGIGEVDARRGATARLRIPGAQLGRRVAGHRAGQGQRVRVGDRRFVTVAAEPGQVEVIDDLGDQFVEALDEFDPGVGVTGHPERGQHQPAELVDGGNGGGIEAGQRVEQVGATLAEFRWGALQQPVDHLIVPRQLRIVESRCCIGDLATHPVTQFLGGGPAEGDQQHLVQPRHTLGDIPGDQCGQCEGLTGTGAGLQHGGRAVFRQRAEQIEGAGFGSRCHQRPPSWACSTGSHNRAA